MTSVTQHVTAQDEDEVDEENGIISKQEKIQPKSKMANR